MSDTVFKATLVLIAFGFTALFCWLMIPALIANPDLVNAFASGFANPFASGYSSDVISCWLILAVWVAYEARAHGVRHGWICLVLGIVPGIAVGFAFYLIMRLSPQNKEALKR